MNYYIFVLGYDLLHDVLNGIECDVAYDICLEVYSDFEGSIYNNPNFSGYMCLSKYIEANIETIKNNIKALTPEGR